MKRKIQQILSVTMCMLFCFFTVTCAKAEGVSEDENSGIKYTYISSISCSLNISGINSTSRAQLYAKSSTSLKIKMELQKLKSGSYSTVETWTATKTGTSLSMEETRLINILATYRLKVTFTAGSETVTSYAYP